MISLYAVVRDKSFKKLGTRFQGAYSQVMWFNMVKCLTLSGALAVIMVYYSIIAQSVKSLPAMQETQVRFLSQEDLLEKETTSHSVFFTWRMPWTEELGRPGESHRQRSLAGCSHSLGSLRVGHDWATSLSLFTFMHWRRKWQPTPVFLPGESQGRSPVGCRLWGRTESDTTEVT